MGNYIYGVIMGFSAAFSWALAAVFYRKALFKSTNPLVTNILRTPLAVISLLIILFFSGELPSVATLIGDVTLLLILLIATFVMNIVGDTLYLTSIRNVGVSVGYPLSYTYPILVAILATFILNENLYWTLFAGTLTSIFGIWLISQRSENKTGKELGDGYSFPSGVLAALGASISFSVGIIIYRVTVKNVVPIVVAVFKLFFLMAMCSPVIPMKARELRGNLDLKTFLFAIIGGLFGIGIGDWFFYLSLESIGAGLAAALTTSAPLLSTLLAVVFLKEKVNRKQLIGTLLIVFGILLTLYR